MAIKFLSIQTISRGAGRSVTAAAAYRSGELIHDVRENVPHDYTRKSGIAHTELIGWEGTRAELWNAAELAEKRHNSVLAREAVLALPHELTQGGREAAARDFGMWVHQRYGVAVDVAVHLPRQPREEDKRSPDERNHHAHILWTTRAVDDAGAFGAKTRVLDVKATGGPEFAAMHDVWARIANYHLEREGHGERLDPQTMRDRNGELPPELRLQPQQHEGPGATALKRAGVPTEVGRANAQTRAANQARQREAQARAVAARRAQEAQARETRSAEVLEHRQRHSPAAHDLQARAAAAAAELAQLRQAQQLQAQQLQEQQRQAAVPVPEAPKPAERAPAERRPVDVPAWAQAPKATPTQQPQQPAAPASPSAPGIDPVQEAATRIERLQRREVLESDRTRLAAAWQAYEQAATDARRKIDAVDQAGRHVEQAAERIYRDAPADVRRLIEERAKATSWRQVLTELRESPEKYGKLRGTSIAGIKSAERRQAEGWVSHPGGLAASAGQYAGARGQAGRARDELRHAQQGAKQTRAELDRIVAQIGEQPPRRQLQEEAAQAVRGLDEQQRTALHKRGMLEEGNRAIQAVTPTIERSGRAILDAAEGPERGRSRGR